MDRDAHYVTIGAFVLLVLAMATGFVMWYSDTRERRDQTRYEIYFRGTVSGLSDGAAVRYLGVDVGRVEMLVAVLERPLVFREASKFRSNTVMANTCPIRWNFSATRGGY